MDETNLGEYFDVFTFWLVNLSSAFMLSAAHNVLFFVLDIRTTVLHFMHFFCTFVFLLCKIGLIKRSEFFARKSFIKLAFFSLYPAIIGQLFLTILSSQVHSQNRSGELYLLRICDFIVTLTALKLNSKFLKSDELKSKESKIRDLLMPVAISGSLSWLEFGHIEYDNWTIFLSPILGLLQALQFVLVKKTFQNFRRNFTEAFSSREKQEDLFEEYLMYFSGFIFVILILPAFISYAYTIVSYDASWESIDYMLIGMSVVYMTSFKYSEFWLLTHLELHHYCALEHMKYFMGSCGQWFLQNMAHATIYAACGKAIFMVAILRYWSGFSSTNISTHKREFLKN